MTGRFGCGGLMPKRGLLASFVQPKTGNDLNSDRRDLGGSISYVFNV